MSENHKKRLWVLLVIVVLVAVLPPILFGSPRVVDGTSGGDTWRNFIYDFQTLIGGGAAIIAAWYTVNQMRVSDAKSEDRHRELVKHQLRPDRLRVERMAVSCLVYLRDDYARFCGFDFNALNAKFDENPRSASFNLDWFKRLAVDTRSTLQREHVGSAKDLMNGEMADGYEFLLKHLIYVETQCSEILHLIGQIQDAIKINDQGEILQLNAVVITKINLLRNITQNVTEGLKDFCDQVSFMRIEYARHK